MPPGCVTVTMGRGPQKDKRPILLVGLRLDSLSFTHISTHPEVNQFENVCFHETSDDHLY